MGHDQHFLKGNNQKEQKTPVYDCRCAPASILGRSVKCSLMAVHRSLNLASEDLGSNFGSRINYATLSKYFSVPSLNVPFSIC